MTKQENSVEILKTQTSPLSKQADHDIKTWIGTRAPEISFETLTDLYYNSFIVSWITDKIANWIASWFETEDEDLKAVLDLMDEEFVYRNFVVNGNAFLEVIRNWEWKVVDVVNVIADTIKVMEDWDWFEQKVDTETVYFNTFTSRKDKQAFNKAQEKWENSWAREDELVNTWSWCWYNPNLNEIYHFKNISLKTKYYWQSFFETK